MWGERMTQIGINPSDPCGPSNKWFRRWERVTGWVNKPTRVSVDIGREMTQSTHSGGCVLRLVVTPVRPPAEGNRLVLTVGEVQTIAATVSAQNCDDCRIELEADSKLFQTVSGPPVVELGSGSFERTVEWRLQAAAPVDDATLGVTAIARGSIQQGFLFVRIHPQLSIEH